MTKDRDESLGGGQTIQPEEKRPSEGASPKSLGDQGTFDGSNQLSDGKSLGDQITFGGEMVASDDFEDGMEVVDLSDRYEVEKALGKGGMGEVLLAVDKRLRRKVAIKRILGDKASSQSAAKRFLAGGLNLAKVNHPNVIQVYECGRAKDGPFLIVELAEGGSLLDRCKQGPIPVEEAVELVCQICDGLAAAHDVGIIHRDIKPANILFTRSGVPKLNDFDLATTQSADTGMTMAGAVLGTLDFMPPEQRQDAALVDARSDLWSLGATLYQMVTGEPPRVIDLDALPPALKTVIAKALKTRKEDRFQSAREFRDAVKSSATAGFVKSPQKKADLVAGECPSCHVGNEAHRKFCRECGESLRCGCLNCKHEIPVWDKVCPECGRKQAELAAKLIGELGEKRDHAERLRAKLAYDDAIAVAREVAAVMDRRLSVHRDWALDFEEATNKERAEKAEAAQRNFEEAKKFHQSMNYDAAIQAIAAIPTPLRLNEVNAFLTRLESEKQKSYALLKTIESSLEKKSNVLEFLPLVKKAVAIQGDRDDLKRLLVKLCQKAVRLGSGLEYSQAIWLAEVISEVKEPELSCHKLWAEEFLLSTKRTQLESIQQQILADRESRRKKQLGVLIGQVLQPGRDLSAQVQKVLDYSVIIHFGEAVRQREAFDYSAAIAAIEAIPQSIRNALVANYLTKLVSEQRESLELNAVIKERIQTRDLEGLLPLVEKASELRGDRADLKKLQLQLAEREQKQRDEVYSRGRQLLAEGNASEAFKQVKVIDRKRLSAEQEKLLVRLEQIGQAESELKGLIERSKADGVVDANEIVALLPKAVAYCKLNPSNRVFLKLRDDLIARTSGVPAEKLRTLPADLVKLLPANVQELISGFKNSIGMRFKWLSPGTFQMGEGSDVHQVKLTKPFYLGIYQVTQEQYERVMGKNPSHFKGAQNPVEQVSWDDAVEFCRKLSALPEEKKAGRVYRLPTEAEWEYACRAGSKAEYCFGDSESELDEYGWFDENSGSKTHPVGQKKPNAWGLYDMHGNVWEWCSDWAGDYPRGAVSDPSGPKTGSRRVSRGGGWRHLAAFCRSAFRYGIFPSYRFHFLGFRVALSSPGIPK